MYTPIEIASSSDIAVSIKEKEIRSTEDSLSLDQSFRNMRKALRDELHVEGINSWNQCLCEPKESDVEFRTKDKE